tara:strand:- start:274 stop:1047 length:774 start_codon:yes stop_codon:yes gene_type:complete
MGLSNSKFAERDKNYGLIEWYMESENYVQLSTLISNRNFNYLEKIPMECHRKGTCSYLHLAAKFNSIIFVKMWLQNKYPINVIDYRGWTALHWAIYYNNSYIFIKLLRSGMSMSDKIPHIVKKKNKKLKDKTALEMMHLLKRTKLIKLYDNFIAFNMNFGHTTNYISEEIYQRESIPDARRLSKSFTFEVLPCNYKHEKFQLIEKIGKWSVYSDKYGGLVWKHGITGRICNKRPDCLKNIVTLSYFNDSNTFSTEHI